VTAKAPKFTQKIEEILADDLDTSGAIARLGEFARFSDIGFLYWSARLLGFFSSPSPDAWFKWRAPAQAGDADPAIDTLVEARIEARKAKNFAEADRIRKELTDQGIVLEDGPSGTTWRRA
jgi:cysteinyl-tRNA synthetase